MSFQPGAVLYTQGFGSRPESVEVPHIDTRAPGSSDTGNGFFPIGKSWVNTLANTAYILTSLSPASTGPTANWTLLGTNGGALNTLSDNSNTTVTPVSNNIQIAGTAGQITTTAGSGVITLSLIGPYTPTTYTAHSVLLGEGGSSIGTVGPDATSGIALISQGSSSDPIFGTVTVAGGGTGATTFTADGVLYGNGTSAIAATAAGTTGQALVGNTSSAPSWTGSPSFSGSVTAATTITATLGAITATNGNLVLGTAGNKLVIASTSSATCSAGTFTLAGTATTTVSNSAVTANSLILLTTQALGTVSAASTLAVTAKSAGTSFTVTPSQSTDTSTIAYLIIN